MSFADNQKLRQSLIATYEDCPSVDRGVLQLMSIIYEGVGKTTLMDYIRRCEFPAFKGLSPAILTQVIDRLIRQNLVVKGDHSQMRCHILLIEEMTRRAVQGGYFAAMAKAVQEKKGSAVHDSWMYFNNYQAALSELRIAFHRGDMPRMQRILETCERSFPSHFFQYPPWLLVFNNPLNPDNLRALPDELVTQALITIFTTEVRNLEPATETSVLAERLLAENRCADVMRYYLAEQAILCGDLAKARNYLVLGEHDYDLALRGWLAFLDGACEDAIQYYESALKLLRKRTRRRKSFGGRVLYSGPAGEQYGHSLAPGDGSDGSPV